jgi:hypothetical protein
MMLLATGRSRTTLLLATGRSRTALLLATTSGAFSTTFTIFTMFFTSSGDTATALASTSYSGSNSGSCHVNKI